MARALIRSHWWLLPPLAFLTWNISQHIFLCDDAFISFRYARHFAEGNGLVFNVGERVEGYTNFLWVLEIALLRLFGVPPEVGAHALSLLCTVGTVALTLLLARGRNTLIFLAILLLATNRNTAVWATGGLETRQFTFFVLLAVFGLHRGRFLLASLAFAAAALTRPEGTFLFACAGLWVLAQRPGLPALRRYALPFLALVGTHFLFRFVYYGEWLPNTYYAKHVRPWPEAGFNYLVTAGIEGGLYLLVPLALLGLHVRRKANDSLHLLAFTLMVPHLVYLLRIGGDHFEFRPLDFHGPLLALAAADGVLALLALIHHPMGRRLAAVALTALLLVYTTALQLTHDALNRGRDTRKETFGLLTEIPQDHWTFRLPLLDLLIPIYHLTQRHGIEHGVGIRWLEHKTFCEHREAQFGPYRPFAHRFGPHHIAASKWIGVAPWVLENITFIDLHGLTDHTIARTPVEVPNEKRAMAHERGPPPGYLATRGVNLDILPAAHAFWADAKHSSYALRLRDDLWMPLKTPSPAWLEAEFREKGLWYQRLARGWRQNAFIVEGQRLRPVQALGFFEGGLDGWTLESGTLNPSARSLTGQVGNLLDTWHPKERDRAKSSVISPVFTAEGFLIFLVGGGRHPDLGVELLVDDERVGLWRGRNQPALEVVAVPLDAWKGRRARVRVFDHATGRWGHIVADHFLLMAAAVARDWR